MDSSVKILLNIILVLAVISQLGIATTSVVAVLGSAGLAAGLALQGSLANFAGGVLILLFKPFKVGDYIIEDTHNKACSQAVRCCPPERLQILCTLPL